MQGGIDQAALVALIVAVCGVIYNAGRLSSRVDSLEKSIDRIPGAISQGFTNIEKLIRGEK